MESFGVTPMSNEDEEWGPWIEHDGKGCPGVGLVVKRKESR